MADVTDKDLTATVAKHYNTLEEAGLDKRVESRIFYMRNFNNWLKSMTIGDMLTRIRREKSQSAPVCVLDLCAGKGGDLLKWKKGRIDHLVCADIAGTSVEQCESRYKEMVERGKHERYQQKVFTAQFITADCTKQRLRNLYSDPDVQFDLVSCQFSFHYSFESLVQAEMMMQNACECLRPGGYFIGTTPNSYEMIKRLRAADDMSFGNEVYRITFHTADKHNIPVFGAKYDFHLEGVVNCPEFVVYFPAMQKLAERYNMRLVYVTPFADYFEQQVHQHEARGLLGRMQALEPYPADPDVELMSKDPASYSHVKQSLDAQSANQDSRTGHGKPIKVGTLSLPEWEATTVYLAFAFQRCDDTKTSTTATRKRKLNEDDNDDTV